MRQGWCFPRWWCRRRQASTRRFRRGGEDVRTKWGWKSRRLDWRGGSRDLVAQRRLAVLRSVCFKQPAVTSGRRGGWTGIHACFVPRFDFGIFHLTELRYDWLTLSYGWIIVNFFTETISADRRCFEQSRSLEGV